MQIEEINLEKVKNHRLLINKCLCCDKIIELNKVNWSADELPEPKNDIVVRTNLRFLTKAKIQFFICIECLLEKSDNINYIDQTEKIPCLLLSEGTSKVGHYSNYRSLTDELKDDPVS